MWLLRGGGHFIRHNREKGVETGAFLAYPNVLRYD
jgi:hypothetical protein